MHDIGVGTLLKNGNFMNYVQIVDAIFDNCVILYLGHTKRCS